MPRPVSPADSPTTWILAGGLMVVLLIGGGAAYYFYSATAVAPGQATQATTAPTASPAVSDLAPSQPQTAQSPPVFAGGGSAVDPTLRSPKTPSSPRIPQNPASSSQTPNSQTADQQRELERTRREVEQLKTEMEAQRREAESRAAAEARRQEEEAARARDVAAAEEQRRRAEEEARRIEIPAGTEMNVRLSKALNSGTVKVEERFETTVVEPVIVGGRTAIPAGSSMRGIVSAVRPATRTNRTAQMTLSFDQATINGTVYPIRGTMMQALSTSGAKEATKIGAAAGVGAIIGGILGGGQGAAIGAGIGGGGIVAATPGSQVQLEQGATLRVRLDAPLQVR